MAEQIGIGTLLGSDFVTTGYADEDGRALIRVKSRLDKLKWQRSPRMKWSREAARQFGAASTIAGGIWKNVPRGLRRLMDAGAFNRLVGICRVMQEWDGNVSDFDGFRNLDLSEESYGPHRVVRNGDGWGVAGLEELMGQIDRVTVVCLNQNSPNSPNFQDLDGGLGAGPEALEGGALGQCDIHVAGGGGLSKCENECEREKRRRRIRRMAGAVADSDFRHDTGRFWDRVEDVYGQEENPKVRYWEGRGMFDYGRVTPPRIVLGQRFLRSPYVSCWPYEGNLGSLDCLNQNSPNSPNFKNGVRVKQNWESAERPDRRVRLWVQACEIGRVREIGGRKGARFELDTPGCSPLGSSGYVTPWTVVGGKRPIVGGFDESGGTRSEGYAAPRMDERELGAGFDERSKMKDERRSFQLDGIEGVGLSLIGHGGTGVFVLIAGIEVAEKRGRHWVRLPWCCKARVVDVVEQNSQNLEDSQNLQRSQDGERDLQNLDGTSGDGVDLCLDGMALEFKELRRELVEIVGVGIGQGVPLPRSVRDKREDTVPCPYGEIFGLGP